MKSNASVLAIVVNYNGGKDVIQCVQSLLDQSYAYIDITVVDNDSKDGSALALKQRFPQITVIDTGYNAGWGVACNIGMKSKDSRYIALINNDAWLEKDCVAEMVRAIELKPEYGSCACKVLLEGGDQLEVCGLLISPDGSSCGRGRLESPEKYSKIEEVFCANDCCCLYKREMIHVIGDYDPDFFIYCDETDMGYRHQMAGWKCIYNPQAIAYHLHSKAAGSFSSFKAYYVERNRIFLLLKYFPLFWIVTGTLRSFLRYGLQIYMVAVGKGSLARYRESHSWWEGLKTLVRAHYSALRLAPTMWKRRREILATRKLSHSEFAHLFRAFGISLRNMARYE